MTSISSLSSDRVLSAVPANRHQTALQLLQRREGTRTNLPLGCPVIDKILRGGFPLGGVTEISGEAGCGKTQICLTLALQCTLPESLGGLDGHTVYLCCGEGQFPAPRLTQLAEAYSMANASLGTSHALMDRVHVLECHNSEDALDVVRKDVPSLIKTHNVRFVIIDSIAGIFRTEFDTSVVEERFERSRAFFRLATELKLLADTNHLGVLVVNQVTAAGFDSAEGGVSDPFRKIDPVPALGLGWSHCVNTRIMLRRDCGNFLSLADCDQEEAPAHFGAENVQPEPNHAGGRDEAGVVSVVGARGGTRRRLVLEFSPSCPSASCEFVITRGGVKGVQGTLVEAPNR